MREPMEPVPPHQTPPAVAATRSVTIVIPAYNEAPAIGPVLDGLKRACGDVVREIIVVDDGSTDDTARIAEGMGARVIRHPRNMGYGAAIKTGIQAAESEFVMTMDGDGQHDPADVPRFLRLSEEHDLVIGHRTQRLHSRLWRMPGKWLLGLLANYLTRQKLLDLNSGMRLIRRAVIVKYLHLCPPGFSFSTTSTLVFYNRGYRVGYVPIAVSRPRTKSTVSPVTGLETLVLILRIMTLFDPLRVFVPLSILLGLFGVAWGLPYAIARRGVSVGALLLLVTALLLFCVGLLSDQISELRKERLE
ncbi:MAG: glycosyltransferase family 2 protein [Deltaproteobacteria bacterium]|nr:glycosyltransferase family 2 protein [Deltaproteobacteria bacterium]